MLGQCSTSEMEWYYAKHGERQGPVSLATLRSMVVTGEVAQTDLVWRKGMADWIPAGQVPEISGVDSESPATPVAPPASGSAAPVTPSTGAQPSSSAPPDLVNPSSTNASSTHQRRGSASYADEAAAAKRGALAAQATAQEAERQAEAALQHATRADTTATAQESAIPLVSSAPQPGLPAQADRVELEDLYAKLKNIELQASRRIAEKFRSSLP